jgi:hypothetical protein
MGTRRPTDCHTPVGAQPRESFDYQILDRYVIEAEFQASIPNPNGTTLGNEHGHIRRERPRRVIDDGITAVQDVYHGHSRVGRRIRRQGLGKCRSVGFTGL